MHECAKSQAAHYITARNRTTRMVSYVGLLVFNGTFSTNRLSCHRSM